MERFLECVFIKLCKICRIRGVHAILLFFKFFVIGPLLLLFLVYLLLLLLHLLPLIYMVWSRFFKPKDPPEEKPGMVGGRWEPKGQVEPLEMAQKEANIRLTNMINNYVQSMHALNNEN